MGEGVAGKAEGVHESLEEARGVVAGRQSGWTRGGGVLAVTEPRDEDQVRGGRGGPNQVEVRGRENGNEITTFWRGRQYRTVIQEDSAVPGRRATGATTLTITRDCDRPIDERKRLPTMQILNKAAKPVRRKEAKVTVKPHTTLVQK